MTLGTTDLRLSSGILGSSQAQRPGSSHNPGFFHYPSHSFCQSSPGTMSVAHLAVDPISQTCTFPEFWHLPAQACCFTLTEKRIESQVISACREGRGLRNHTDGANHTDHFWGLLFGRRWRLNSGHFGFVASGAWLPASWLAMNNCGLSVELCSVTGRAVCTSV